VGTDGFSATPVNGVPDTEFGAGLLHDACDARIVDVAHARKQVMLDLKVETTDVPAQETIAPSEVGGGLHLVHRPRPFHSPIRWIGMWERDLLDAVRQLKDQDEDEAQ
jgi:hypothetical protein